MTLSSLITALMTASLFAAEPGVVVPPYALIADEDEAMPHLSAGEWLEACLYRNQSNGRRADCIGEYSSACMDRADGQTNSGMIRCTVEEYEAWDSRLNQAYAALQGELPPVRAEALRDAQRAWITLRDADCEYEASAYQSGSMQPLIRSGCWLDYASRRTLTLMEWQEQPY